MEMQLDCSIRGNGLVEKFCFVLGHETRGTLPGAPPF